MASLVYVNADELPVRITSQKRRLFRSAERAELEVLLSFGVMARVVTMDAPPCRPLVVGEPGGPELPEHAYLTGADVLVAEPTGGAPLVRERDRCCVERSLPLEQELVLVLQHRDEKVLSAAEVVLHEREADGAAGGNVLASSHIDSNLNHYEEEG